MTCSLAAIWLTNGLVCKVLGLVPRHEQIVARILGDGFSRPLTLLIGLAEMGVAAWILTGWIPRTNAIAQIILVATMNILEFFLAPDLLLWGRVNAVFAALFIGLIYYWEFVLNYDDTEKSSVCS
ncbi:DoxX-like family protein [Parapedobacter sp. GCM10030251]|uniref:DoxX-like family protein n=1 Tax=Parapedobacter sp. GCM10030251 TaxID=3273419 RepID=UPI00361DBA50